MSTQPTETEMLSHRIASELRRAVLAGDMKPGARIRQEELAAQFGTSRIPVREALWQLETEGLVIVKPNSGAWIAKLDLADCVEVYKIRERIEPLALAESIQRMTDADVRSLTDMATQIEADLHVMANSGQAADSPAALDNFLRRDREFHLLTYKAAGMPRLYSIIERFWNTTQQYRRAFSHIIGHEGHRVVRYEHRLLVDAIVRRDIEGASNILAGHIRRTRIQLESHKEIF